MTFVVLKLRLAMSWGSCVKIALLLTSGDLQSAEVRHQFNAGDVTWGIPWGG